MNLILHQIRTDLRACRVFLMVSIPIAIFAPLLAASTGRHLSGELVDVGKGILGTLVLLTAVVSLAASIGTTPFVGSSAFWRTRPLSQGSLFWARSLWLALFVLAPIGIGIVLSVRFHRFTAGQAAIVGLSLGGGALALLVLLAALRAASEGNWRFKMQVAGAVGVVAISSFLMGITLRGHARDYLPYQQASSVLVAELLVLVLGVVAWILVGRFRRPPAAIFVVNLAVFLFPWAVALCRITLLPKPVLPQQALTLALVEPDEVRSGKVGEGLLLWENLNVKGLGPKQLFLPERLERSWGHDESDTINFSYQDQLRFDQIITTNDVWKRIKTDYPAGTDWFVENSHYRRAFGLPTGAAGSPARFSLETSGMVLELQRLSSVPLKDGAWAALADGGVMNVHNPVVEDHQLVFDLSMLRPIPPLRGEWPFVDSKSGLGDDRADGVWLVLYHEAGRTALGGQVRHRMGGRQSGPTGLLVRDRPRYEFPVPSLQLELLGIDTEQWLEEVELHLYTVKPVARFISGRLVRDNYRMSPRLPSSSRLLSGDFAKATLSGDPTEHEIASHLDTLIYDGPDNRGDHPYLEKFRALPPAALVALTKRLPVHDDANRAALTVLAKNLSVLPDEILMDGLRRDGRFASLCARKNLRAEAAAILRERLRERHPLADGAAADAIGLVAGEIPLDDELAGDLHWHFVHAGRRQQNAAPVLAELDGFDFRGAVEEAWNDRRFDNSDYAQTGLAPFALRLGDKEALRLTLKRHRDNQPKLVRKRDLELLVESLATDLPPEEALRWAVANFPELQFDPETGRFEVGE